MRANTTEMMEFMPSLMASLSSYPCCLSSLMSNAVSTLPWSVNLAMDSKFLGMGSTNSGGAPRYAYMRRASECHSTL